MEGTGQPAPEYRQNEFMVYATIRQAKDAVTTEKTTEKILSLILENLCTAPKTKHLIAIEN
jgi:hypothetical protein